MLHLCAGGGELESPWNVATARRTCFLPCVCLLARLASHGCLSFSGCVSLDRGLTSLSSFTLQYPPEMPLLQVQLATGFVDSAFEDSTKCGLKIVL